MTIKITKIICAATLLAAAATPALSQAKNFAGPSIGIGGGYASQTSKPKLSYVDSGPQSVTLGSGQNNFSALIDLSYGIQLDKSFILSLGGSYDLTDSKVDLYNDTAGYGIKFKLKDHYSVYLQPTYLVNDSLGLFGKLTYNFAKANGSINDDTTTVSNSKNLEGWGYGVGIKTLLNNNTYIQVEGNYVEYDNYKVIFNEDTNIVSKPKVLSALISVGYKF